jgi:LysR family hydrogen peroxide-inducible transcriptional activator
MEEFYAYTSHAEVFPRNKYIMPKDIGVQNLWLLEEGHCLRSQVMNFCELRKVQEEEERFVYEAGSIETLINLIDHHEGTTIVPGLAISRLNANQKKKIREFPNPKPVREISLVTQKDYPRKKLLELVVSIIRKNTKEYDTSSDFQVIGIK